MSGLTGTGNAAFDGSSDQDVTNSLFNNLGHADIHGVAAANDAENEKELLVASDQSETGPEDAGSDDEGMIFDDHDLDLFGDAPDEPTPADDGDDLEFGEVDDTNTHIYVDAAGDPATAHDDDALDIDADDADEPVEEIDVDEWWEWFHQEWPRNPEARVHYIGDDPTPRTYDEAIKWRRAYALSRADLALRTSEAFFKAADRMERNHAEQDLEESIDTEVYDVRMTARRYRRIGRRRWKIMEKQDTLAAVALSALEAVQIQTEANGVCTTVAEEPFPAPRAQEDRKPHWKNHLERAKKAGWR
ncbi:hypothetical protein V8F20_011845 [Naviculisporaceae sp. PSN 640]